MVFLFGFGPAVAGARALMETPAATEIDRTARVTCLTGAGTPTTGSSGRPPVSAGVMATTSGDDEVGT